MLTDLEKPTILIVDDEELNRQLLSLILQDDYNIVEAADGLEALKVLENEYMNISLIMLDIVMPVMDGFEFLEEFKKNILYNNIPIIFVTAETYMKNIIRGVEAGVCDVIAKPYDPNLISCRVDHLIQLTKKKEKEDKVRQAHQQKEQVSEEPKKPKTILIVDDVKINRVIMKTALESEYKILEAENGEEAIRIIGENHDNLAAVLLDIIMPVMDGIQMMTTARRLKLLRDVPVIAITTEDSPVKMNTLRELGICEIIHKPYDPVVVKNRVNNMVELFFNLKKMEV